MTGRIAALTFAIAMFTVAVMGGMMGAEAGYAADSPVEATASFNGTHFAVGGNVTAVETQPHTADDPRPATELVNGTALDFETPADPYIEGAVRGFVESMLLADSTEVGFLSLG